MAKKKSEAKKEGHWPWDWCGQNMPTDAVMAEIVRNLPSYACDALDKKPEDVGMTDDSLYGCFQIYCHVVKDHFEKTAREAPDSIRQKLSVIAEEAFGLIDKLLEYVDKRLYPPSAMTYIPADYPHSYFDLRNQWDTVARKFDLCVSPTTEKEKPANLTETEQNIVEALGDQTLTGEQLAEKAGYPYNSNFKNILSSLRKREILGNKSPGYFVEH